jgi:hypothetical protein
MIKAVRDREQRAPTMATEPSKLETPPQRARRIPPLPGALVAFIIGWFLSWPIVFFAWIPIQDASGSYYFVTGGGWLLWFISCIGICGPVLRIYGRHRPWMVGWFFGWFPLCSVIGHSVSLIGHGYWIAWSLFSLGTILWLISCYGIYDLLFKMAEARWPEAKSIRETLESLIKSFVRSHHSP